MVFCSWSRRENKGLLAYLQSWPKLCGTSLQNALPRPSISFSHWNKRSLGQILPSSPSPHAMWFVRKGLPTSRPTLHRGGRGSERILQQFGKKALCPTHFGQDCMYVRTYALLKSENSTVEHKAHDNNPTPMAFQLITETFPSKNPVNGTKIHFQFNLCISSVIYTIHWSKAKARGSKLGTITIVLFNSWVVNAASKNSQGLCTLWNISDGCFIIKIDRKQLEGKLINSHSCSCDRHSIHHTIRLKS